ncbi:MAG: GlsB/YeaQ/YmgE family stress response membrane protein [Chloroflexota bacterium]|nr:MAG: GlsB/YeaQ/YmgE family stress response membrane protein [Chloroflexota bacterium]
MAPLAIALIVLMVLMAAGTMLAFWSIGLAIKLGLAGLIGGLADMVVPGRLPYGFLGAIGAGVVGGWLGSALLPALGPALFGVEIVPTFLGALVVVAGFELVATTRGKAG